MKHIAIVLLGLALSGAAQAADIRFFHGGSLISLVEAYEAEDLDALEAFFQFFTAVEPTGLSPEEMCAVVTDVRRVADEIEDLEDSLEYGIFEEHGLIARPGNQPESIDLTLVDRPNQWDVGTVTIQICPTDSTAGDQR